MNTYRRSDNFWKNVLRALGASPLANRVLRGESGMTHEFRAVGVDTERGIILAVLVDGDERLAALVYRDLNAASVVPVILVRPVGVDSSGLMALLVDERSSIRKDLWAAFSGSEGGRISGRAARALLAGWRRHIGSSARTHPLTPVERLSEVLRVVGGLRVRPGTDGTPEFHAEPGREAGAVAEGIWDFPLYLLTEDEIREIKDTIEDEVTPRILARHAIRMDAVPAASDRSPLRLIPNRHRSIVVIP